MEIVFPMFKGMEMDPIPKACCCPSFVIKMVWGCDNVW